MKTKYIAAVALVVSCISTSASAGWNAWDWGNFFRAITPPPAPTVIYQQPTVVVVPLPVAPPQQVAPDPTVGPCFKFGTEVPCVAGAVYDGPTVAATQPIEAQECEEKPYIQYKDELKVFGGKATVAQMCQIKAGTTLACDRELTKITLVLRAADFSVDDCVDPSSLPLLK